MPPRVRCLGPALADAGLPVRMIDPQGERKAILNQRRQNKYATADEARMEALRQFG